MAPDMPSAGRLWEMKGGQSSAAKRTMRELAAPGAAIGDPACPCARASVEYMSKQKGKPTVRRKRMFGSYGLARLAVQARQQDWRSVFFNHRLDKNHAPTKKRNCKVVYFHFDIPTGNEIRLRRACNSSPWHTLSLSRNRFLLVRAPDGR